MKKEKEITFKMQFLKIVLSHLKAVGIILLVFFFMGVAFWGIHDIVTMIMKILILVVYVGFMASAAKSCAAYDLKEQSTTKAFPVKGFLLAIPVMLLNLAVWGILQWVHAGNMPEMVQVVMRALFLIWTIPYYGFLDQHDAWISVIGHILMYAVPFVTIGLGYFAGYKKWDIYKKLDKIVFEEQPKK